MIRCRDCPRPMPTRGLCALCSAFRTFLSKLVNSGCRVPGPGHEERVKRYMRRAAKELPLFEEARR
jgi:hypothetical protein